MIRNWTVKLELFGPTGEILGEALSANDWDPAVEWARLQALRRGWSIARACSSHNILPFWDRTGRPRMAGFQVQIGDRDRSCSVFGLTYWKNEASTASSRVISTGALRPGDQFFYRVTAEEPEGRIATGVPSFGCEELPPDITIREGRLSDHLRNVVPSGEMAEEDIPVFIPSRVLAETKELMRQAEGNEVGGALLGHLRRDVATGEVYLEVTAQIPARHTVNSGTRVTFTAETWASFITAIQKRARGEELAGWYHTHPERYWTAQERAATGANSAAATTDGRAFFSAEDCALHRTVFPGAHSIALLLSDYALGDGEWSTAAVLFGWRLGVIEHRQYFTSGCTGARLARTPIVNERRA